MSLQGPLIVVAEQPAAHLVELLREAGAFPVVETKWADAPTALVAVKPNAVVVAEPGTPPSETGARMLCLQIATSTGAIIPVVALTAGEDDAAVPIAIPVDMNGPEDRLLARLRRALRVRALHQTVLRRIETYGANSGRLPALPVGDALEEATVMIMGRGQTYPALSVAWANRVKMIGALSVEAAAQNLSAHDINGVVIAEGLNPRMVEAFLTVLSGEPKYRDIPIAVLGDELPDMAHDMSNVDLVTGDPSRVVAHMVPRVRLNALEIRLNRMLKALETEGMFDPETGLMAQNGFWAELTKAMSEANKQSQALSVARFAFDAHDRRTQLDGARLATRLIRNIDFAGRDDDGALLVAFTQTDLYEAQVVARRLAGALKKGMAGPGHLPVTANVTLAAMKANDSIDTLMARIAGAQTVAAE
ncbi:MAG: GGDEF domain-containing protein [Xanthobacteraceae bacterium]|uniref:GGDEF domain-containing protein n=1 Tax=Pseudolabrys sp. TaxID=1960880 RepID=UPI003D0FE3EB